jgi:amino acid transporter
MSIDEQPKDRRLFKLTHNARFAAVAFFISFLALLIFSFSIGLPNNTLAVLLLATIVAALFASGLACILLFFTRGMIIWKRNRWRFSLRELLFTMTAIAIALVLLVWALKS